MKKKYLTMMSWALIASMGVFSLASCDDDDNNDDNNNGDGDGTEIVVEEGATLNGEVENGQTMVLSENGNFMLSGGFTVREGGKLVIKPGVTITAVEDDDPDYILICQGGQIDAQGTATNPIVMTSEDQTSGGWGGIHICGYAHTNRGSGTLSEIGNAPYGGDDDADTSGILRYIRLEYTGFALDPEHEANGVSFYGVGSGTTRTATRLGPKDYAVFPLSRDTHKLQLFIYPTSLAYRRAPRPARGTPRTDGPMPS